jgi:hypothetical protein
MVVISAGGDEGCLLAQALLEFKPENLAIEIE